ncbi:hypothetical protein MA16_Dca002682 [Dendrobium catenatum]|uniref:Uncharacterized protein n=1 Tax=Dendrobium catenatum TaxID=906689 RepID=A0A2I0X8E7_9ASPA|nr:hypothetical protein MA16_Dca002682 [Dendrobium catenatum]
MRPIFPSDSLFHLARKDYLLILSGDSRNSSFSPVHARDLDEQTTERWTIVVLVIRAR